MSSNSLNTKEEVDQFLSTEHLQNTCIEVGRGAEPETHKYIFLRRKINSVNSAELVQKSLRLTGSFNSKSKEYRFISS